ncbi:uncharacterized protein [Typha angustifolia]|uniref:uncharacterized protein isoform X1 n=1 Tax=Typha angustifolia TaxID=59011 RepID=UPI003C2CB36B
MSRIPKWKSEKTKVKVVFRLQFHATHIPQTGWDKLFVSLIPTDAKQPTAKTNKANVRNGNCKWSDPIYETTRLLQDTRTKKYDEKLYTLVVATGLSRSGLLGEVDINLADFAAALKPSSVALPLHGCDYGTVLHVIVQLLTSKTGFREFEQQRELSVKGFQKISNQRSHNPLETITTSSEFAGDTTNKVNARVEFKEDHGELPAGKEMAESNEDCEISAAGLDGSSYTSDSLCAEKNDISGEHEVDSFKNKISGDIGGFPLIRTSVTKKEEQRSNCLPTQGSNEWTCGWNSDYSADNDLATAYEENNMLRLRLEVAESAFLQLKTEANTLQSITNELGAGTQSLAEQLSFELDSGKQLMKEVSMLKSECSGFKNDIEKLKSRNKPTSSLMIKSDLADASFDGKLVNNFLDGDHKVHDVQTKWLQALLLIESKVQEIQKKTFLGYCKNDDFHFLHADFEVLEFVLDSLKQSISQQRGLEGYARAQYFEDRRNFLDGSCQFIDKHDPHKTNLSAENMMEEKICELLQKLEESKTEKESLMKEMSHMECYYERLIQDLKESQNQTINELENLRSEYSSCLYTISLLQENIEKGHQEMNEQLMRFVKDRNTLESQNKELEERALVLETALRRVRWNYSVAVDSLQKDLELLSSQVLSLYETNENLTKQAFTDADENFHEEHTKLYLVDEVQTKEFQSKDEACADEIDSSNPLWEASQHCCIPIKNLVVHADLPPEIEKHEVSLERSAILWSDVDFQSVDNADTDKQQLNNENGVEEIKTLRQLKELYSNMEAELSELHAANIQWKTFSDILLETLYGATDGITCMKNRIVELEQQLDHSNNVKETSALDFHSALDQTKTLQEDGTKYISKCDDLTSNQTLRAKFQDLSAQNTSPSEKCENLMMEWRAYESKYKVCTEERNKLENLLIQESLEKSHLQTEMDSMIKDYKSLEEKFYKQTSLTDDFQKIVAHLQGGLNNLYSNMISCNRQIDTFDFSDTFLQDEVEGKTYAAIFSHLEQFQKQTCQKILQLHQEKEMEEMKDSVRSTLKIMESEMFDMKQRFESDLEALTAKLQISTELNEMLQLKLRDVTWKLKISLEAEEKHAKINRELSSRVELMEVEIQCVTNESRDLLQKAQISEGLKEELERTKISLTNCKQENRTLVLSMQSKNEVFMQMENELRSVKESLRSTCENVHIEKGLREELESAISNITLQLKGKGQHLVSFNEQKAELVQLRDWVLEMEKENIQMQNLLSCNEKNQNILNGENISLRLQVAEHENYVADFLENLLVADIQVIYMRSQVQELVSQVKTLGKDHEELHMKLTDSVLHLSIKDDLVDKNTRLSTALQQLQSELDKFTHEKENPVDHIIKNLATWIVSGNMNPEDATIHADNCKGKQNFEDEILRLTNMLVSLEEQVDYLRSSRDELEFTNIILRSKIEEQQLNISFLLECDHELRKLREQHNELTHKLFEQIQKTEEFKNLSVHLREMKNKADTECNQAREKMEKKGSSFATQESLRIVFIKEQYESKIQELKNQLYVSAKYAEEVLLKLQNTLDEVERGKKNEASLAKRIEELSVKFSDVETELHMVQIDRKELIKAYDSIKTELQHSILSLDHCKEEKLKLEDSLQECHEEREKMKVELGLVKQLLHNMAASDNIQSEGNHGFFTPEITPIGQHSGGINSVFENVYEEMSSIHSGKGTALAACLDPLDNVDGRDLQNTRFSSGSCGDGQDLDPGCVKENAFMSSLPGSQASENGKSEPERKKVLEDNTVDSITIEEHFREQQRLKTGMKLFQNELERLKNENLSSLLPLVDNEIDASQHGFQGALLHLDMANEHLKSTPLSNELPTPGNAYGTVLALELESEAALGEKEETDVHSESSFLKQHNDKEPDFQSFGDTKELIQGMLEMKRRNNAVETELKEMHTRYSQLSLRFAEVEGERQKLMVTLKIRSPKKL